MSRSVHATLRELSRLRRAEFADRDTKAKLLCDLRTQLRRKHRIKASVLKERRRVAPPLAGTSPTAIPVVVTDDAAHVHHPLCPTDLQSLLYALPPAAIDGISEVRLCLGKEYMEEENRDGGSEDRRDPWTGRLGSELLPKVYTGDVFGTYHPSSARSNFTRMYDEAELRNLPLPEAAAMAYLRLHALKTFIHEVAHHHDYTQRIARGRWLADRTPTVEHYAESMEYKWTLEIGVPWLENRFSEETAALKQWLERFGGIKVSLEWLAGDPRITCRDGMQRLAWSIGSAFESFVETLAGRDQPVIPSPEIHLEFAWDLHYSDEYDCCLRILDGILTGRPDWIKAQQCRVDTLIHLERYEEAWTLADEILVADPANAAAWTAKGDVLEERQQWQQLLELCSAWEAAVGGLPLKNSWNIAAFRAVAFCGLERWEEMERWLEAWSGDRLPLHKEHLRRAAFRRAGKTLAAKEVVT